LHCIISVCIDEFIISSSSFFTVMMWFVVKASMLYLKRSYLLFWCPVSRLQCIFSVSQIFGFVSLAKAPSTLTQIVNPGREINLIMITLWVNTACLSKLTVTRQCDLDASGSDQVLQDFRNRQGHPAHKSGEKKS